MNELAQRITDYLSSGGLFNPEMANHEAVSDLLIECRAALIEQEAAHDLLKSLQWAIPYLRAYLDPHATGKTTPELDSAIAAVARAFKGTP